MALKRINLLLKYGDMFNFLSFVRNLPAPLSFMVQGKFACINIIYGGGKFACTTIIYGAGKFASHFQLKMLRHLELKFACITIIYGTGKICLHHYQSWCSTNLPLALLFIPIQIEIYKKLLS